jgi:hypothetical protein
MTSERLVEIRQRIATLAAARAKVPHDTWHALPATIDGVLTHVVTPFPGDFGRGDDDYGRYVVGPVSGNEAMFIAAARNLDIERDAIELLEALEAVELAGGATP